MKRQQIFIKPNVATGPSIHPRILNSNTPQQTLTHTTYAMAIHRHVLWRLHFSLTYHASRVVRLPRSGPDNQLLNGPHVGVNLPICSCESALAGLVPFPRRLLSLFFLQGSIRTTDFRKRKFGGIEKFIAGLSIRHDQRLLVKQDPNNATAMSRCAKLAGPPKDRALRRESQNVKR